MAQLPTPDERRGRRSTCVQRSGLWPGHALSLGAALHKGVEERPTRKELSDGIKRRGLGLVRVVRQEHFLVRRCWDQSDMTNSHSDQQLSVWSRTRFHRRFAVNRQAFVVALAAGTGVDGSHYVREVSCAASAVQISGSSSGSSLEVSATYAHPSSHVSSILQGTMPAGSDYSPVVLRDYTRCL